jgi:hypothetical protein
MSIPINKKLALEIHYLKAQKMYIIISKIVQLELIKFYQQLNNNSGIELKKCFKTPPQKRDVKIEMSIPDKNLTL